MAFNLFPYTNFHKLNLDWILTKVKEALAAALHAEQSAAAAEQAVATAQQAAETAQQAAEAAQEAAEAAQADVDTLDANAVQYVPQERSDALQAQARQNISAASVAYVDQQPHVPAVQAGDAGKVLTAGGSGYAWEVPLAISGTADVLMVNITGSGSSYSADKTFAQIGQALVAHWPVIFVVNGELQIANVHDETVNSATVYSGVFVGEDYRTVKVTIDSGNAVTITEGQLPDQTPYYKVAIPISATLQPESGQYTGQTWADILEAVESGKLVCTDTRGSLMLLPAYSKTVYGGTFDRISGNINSIVDVVLTPNGWQTVAVS